MIYEKREQAIERHLCSATVSETRRKASNEEFNGVSIKKTVKRSSRYVYRKLRALS